MREVYDLVIVGTGTAAMVAAMRVRAAGWSVAVIDFASRMRGHGVAGELDIDWPDLIAFKRSFTDSVPAKHERMYAAKGIDTFHGQARLTGRNTMKVDDKVLEGRHFLIAAGAEPVELGIPGEEYLATSEDFLNLERMPQRMVLVGGGYVAAEFSHIAARAGAKVTILQRGERMLAHFDPDLVDWLMEKFATIGIDVRTRTQVEGIEKTGTGFAVRANSKGASTTVEADIVVHAAGRAPALDALDLRTAEVSVKSGRLELNEYLQSVSNPAIYAAGDAAQMGPPLTPVSSHDAKIAVANMLDGNKLKPNYMGVPSVAFSVPPIAAVGLSEAEARKQGLGFRVKSQKASGWYTARRIAEKTYGFKVLVEEGTGCILGAHLVGPHVDEVINVFALAIRKGLTAEDLKTTMFAYPTGASDIGYMV